MDPLHAAKFCAKMLLVRSPDRVQAVLNAITSGGIDPWAVAVQGGPAAWEKLVALGVRLDEMPLLKLAVSSDWRDRREAARALNTLHDSPEALAALFQLARDKETEVCGAAARALSLRDTPEVVGALVALAEHPSKGVRQAAGDSLGRFPDSNEALKALLKLSLEASPRVHWAAAKSLGNFPDSPEVQEALVRLSKEKDPYTRRAARMALKDFKSKSK